jgi:hypothetical protein
MELPWLLTIAKNVCSTRRRSGMRRGTYESPQDLDSIQDRLATPDRSDVASPADLRSALREIPESQRKALLLREWRGLSYDEIGVELGLSQSATEALLFRARQNVAQRLGAGLKALNGLPLVSFVRGLFETGTAKLVAAAVGTTLTLAVVPAAQPPRSDVGAPLPRVTPSQSVSHSAAAPRQSGAAPSRSRQANRPADVPQRGPIPATGTSAPTTEDATAPRSDVSSAPKPSPARVQTDASTPAPAPKDITSATPDVGVDVPLPAVTTPAITTPVITVPPVTVEVPPPPKVQLP